MRWMIAGICLGLLSACADPLDKVEKLSDVPVAPSAVAALPSAEEVLAQDKGLFARLRELGKPDSSSVTEPQNTIALGARLPFGEVGVVCGVKLSQLGKKLDSYPPKHPVYRLYDSDPKNENPHALFIAGFNDGCVRQIWASVAVFGSAEMHEQLRYVLPDAEHPYSATDTAYEKVKRQVCKVGRKKPCGDKLPRLLGNTVFVSAYDRYGDAKGWANVLLHDGALMASDTVSLGGS